MHMATHLPLASAACPP